MTLLQIVPKVCSHFSNAYYISYSFVRNMDRINYSQYECPNFSSLTGSTIFDIEWTIQFGVLAIISSHPGWIWDFLGSLGATHLSWEKLTDFISTTLGSLLQCAGAPSRTKTDLWVLKHSLYPTPWYTPYFCS